MVKLRFEEEVDENLADSLITTAHSNMERQKQEERIIWAGIGGFVTIIALLLIYMYCF